VRREGGLREGRKKEERGGDKITRLIDRQSISPIKFTKLHQNVKELV